MEDFQLMIAEELQACEDHLFVVLTHAVHENMMVTPPVPLRSLAKLLAATVARESLKLIPADTKLIMVNIDLEDDSTAQKNMASAQFINNVTGVPVLVLGPGDSIKTLSDVVARELAMSILRS